MNRSPVVSGNLASVGYDAKTQTLEIEFKDRSIYQYFGVPPTVHAELLAAQSVGSYLARNVKGIYRFAKL